MQSQTFFPSFLGKMLVWISDSDGKCATPIFCNCVSNRRSFYRRFLYAHTGAALADLFLVGSGLGFSDVG